MSKAVQLKGTIYEKGYGLISKKIMKNSQLSLGAKAVYSYLCAYAGSDGQSFPSIDLIAHELNITRKTFYKYINELTNLKCITKEKIRGEKGKFDNNIYIIESIVAMVENLPHGKKSTEENLPFGKNVPTTINNLITSNNSSNSSSKGDMSQIYKTYEQLGFGTLNQMTVEMIEDDIQKYSKEWFLEALKVAVKENKYKLSYVEGILQNWKRNGGISKAGDMNGSKFNNTANNKQAKNAGENKSDQYDFTEL